MRRWVVVVSSPTIFPNATLPGEITWLERYYYSDWGSIITRTRDFGYTSRIIHCCSTAGVIAVPHPYKSMCSQSNTFTFIILIFFINNTFTFTDGVIVAPNTSLSRTKCTHSMMTIVSISDNCNPCSHNHDIFFFSAKMPLLHKMEALK